MKKILSLILILLFVGSANAGILERLGFGSKKQNYTVLISGSPGGAIEGSFKDFNSVMAESDIQFNMVSRPGGAGLVAMKDFLSAKDNKTLIWVGASLSVANSTLKKKPEYTMEDYRPVVLSSKATLLFVNSPNSNKIANFNELFAPGCDKRIVISYSSMHGEVPARILQKASTCNIEILSYKGDAGPLADVLNGSLDIALIPWVTAEGVVDQGGKILATTADPKDDMWTRYQTLHSKVPGAIVYGLYGLWAPKSMPDSEYYALVKEIGKYWGNESLRKEKSKYLKKGAIHTNLYGDEYRDFLKSNLIDLRKLSTQFNFQR